MDLKLFGETPADLRVIGKINEFIQEYPKVPAHELSANLVIKFGLPSFALRFIYLYVLFVREGLKEVSKHLNPN